MTKLEALRLFMYEESSHLVEHAMEQALLKSEYGIAVERRVGFKKRMAGEQASDAGLSVQEENKGQCLSALMFLCIDRFHSELETRSRAIKDLADTFESVQLKSLTPATEEDLKVSVPKLTNVYNEVSHSELFAEIPRLRRHLNAAKIDS